MQLTDNAQPKTHNTQSKKMFFQLKSLPTLPLKKPKPTRAPLPFCL